MNAILEVVIEVIFMSKKRTLIEVIVLLLSGLVLYFFTSHDAFLYKQDIGRVIKVENAKPVQTEDAYENKDETTEQSLTLKIINGSRKGEIIHLKNQFSKSGAYDQEYFKGQQVFLKLHHDGGKLTAVISHYKRDTYLVMMLWLVVGLLYLTMHAKGLRALLSVAINFVIFLIFVQMDVDFDFTNFFWLFAISAVLFTGLSLILVIGWNKQTLVSFLSIVIGTTMAMAIGIGILNLTGNNGIHYEALDYATQQPEQLFLSATIIGLLGAVLDASTDIVSTLFELKRTQPDISAKQLFKSGQGVGHAIMGPLINVLLMIFFAETFAIAVLYFRTGNTYGYTFAWAMGLGVAQALISGIGITLVIPTASFLCSRFLSGRRAG